MKRGTHLGGCVKLSRGYDCVPRCLRADREVILRRKLDVPRFVLRSCTCPRAIRSCGIIEFHWIRSVAADRIDDCVRELELPRNSSDRGLLSIERPRRGGRTNRIISKMARGILFATRNGGKGFRIDSVQILIVTSPRKARNLRGPLWLIVWRKDPFFLLLWEKRDDYYCFFPLSFD